MLLSALVVSLMYVLLLFVVMMWFMLLCFDVAVVFFVDVYVMCDDGDVVVILRSSWML